jgi:predicted DNA-binding protein (MmcQ/YjbR family)
LAFRSGRAAIVANEYEKRDEQANIIKAKLALACGKSCFYLQEGKRQQQIKRRLFILFQKLMDLYVIALQTNQVLTTLILQSEIRYNAYYYDKSEWNKQFLDIDTLGQN